MKLSSKIMIVVLMVAGSSGAVYAFSKGGHWHMTPEEKADFVTEKVTKKLDLDAQQRQNFETLAETVMDIMIEVKASKSAQMDELDALLQEPSFNQARALEMIQDKTSMVNQKAPLVISNLAIFLDSLNAEQKQQINDFLEHRRQHHKHRHSH